VSGVAPGFGRRQRINDAAIFEVGEELAGAAFNL
jgi:hypothetical protein